MKHARITRIASNNKIITDEKSDTNIRVVERYLHWSGNRSWRYHQWFLCLVHQGDREVHLHQLACDMVIKKLNCWSGAELEGMGERKEWVYDEWGSRHFARGNLDGKFWACFCVIFWLFFSLWRKMKIFGDITLLIVIIRFIVSEPRYKRVL